MHDKRKMLSDQYHLLNELPNRNLNVSIKFRKWNLKTTIINMIKTSECGYCDGCWECPGLIMWEMRMSNNRICRARNFCGYQEDEYSLLKTYNGRELLSTLTSNSITGRGKEKRNYKNKVSFVSKNICHWTRMSDKSYRRPQSIDERKLGCTSK